MCIKSGSCSPPTSLQALRSSKNLFRRNVVGNGGKMMRVNDKDLFTKQ